MRFPKIIIVMVQLSCIIYLTSCKSSINVSKSRKEDFNSNTKTKAPAKAERIVDFAEKYLGTPYKSAGVTSAGFDCSGFCLFVFKEFGIELPRKSDEQAKLGKQIPVAQAQKGDLIFFKGSDKNKPTVGHVGIVVSTPGERIKFIHSSTSKGIIFDYLDVKYFSERFVSVKRVL